MNSKDTIFSEPFDKKFEFDENVASVFDDMLPRSVPFYEEVIELVTNIISTKINANDTVVDFGCSTATTLIELAKKNDNVNLIGFDTSSAMIARAKRKIKAFGFDIDVRNEDFLKSNVQNVKAVLSNYTLQFIKPKNREAVVQKIYNSLSNDAIFIFSEKIIYENEELNTLLVNEYYSFKQKNGYSNYEIAQKKEALENVLIPYTGEQNKQMVLNAGFKEVQTVFKWANFATFIAYK